MIDYIDYSIIWSDYKFFLLNVKSAKIFEWKCKSNWKVYWGPVFFFFYTGRPNVNKIDLCMKLGTRVRWRNNFERWHHNNNILN